MINKKMEQLGIEKSAIRELFEQGKILKEKYGKDEVFDFSIGNPNIPCPKIVNDTLKNILDIANNCDANINSNDINNITNYAKLNSCELHGYTSAQGDFKVRESISSYLNKTYKTNTNSNLIYITAGAAAGLSIVLKALIDNDNEEVIIFTPFFPEYKVFINNSKAKAIQVKPNLSNFYPDFNDFESKINKNTNIVIVNSPNNPSGILYKENIIIKICDILNEKQKEYNHPIYLISDEPYRELIYTNEKFPFITNYYDNSIITYSFSKSISLPGERIGYILINPKCENANNVYNAICGAGRSLGFVCANSLFQYLIPYILGITSDINIYKDNAQLLYNELTNIGYEVVKPDGAFYLFVKALIDNDNDFSKTALSYNLLLVPSESFGITGYVRIAYCVTKKQILNSIPYFKKLYNHYKG